MKMGEDMQLYKTAMEAHGDAIRKYTREWSYNSSDPKELERKIEELVWMNVIIYGIAGWTKDKDYNADFFQ
jgi:Questin oxidase-like